MVVESVPYTEVINLQEQYIIREFNNSVESDELIWHRDHEDRIIEPIEISDWLFQFENNLPIQIKSKIYIPKNTYHRIIKVGDDNLKLKIWKLQ